MVTLFVLGLVGAVFAGVAGWRYYRRQGDRSPPTVARPALTQPVGPAPSLPIVAPRARRPIPAATALALSGNPVLAQPSPPLRPTPVPPTVAVVPVVGGACPGCRRRYRTASHCVFDGRALSAALSSTHGRALQCPRCARGYAHGLTRCPEDAVELVVVASKVGMDVEPAFEQAVADGSAACPSCRARYGAPVAFCPRDGARLTLLS